MSHRLVVTGTGAVTPIGIGVKDYWHNLLAGVCGVRNISHFDASLLPTRIAAEVTDFELPKSMPKALARSASLFMQFAFAAGEQALEQAQLTRISSPERTGICIGTAMGGVSEISDRAVEYSKSHTGKISPHFIPRAIGNMAAAILAIAFNIQGPGMTLGTACSAGSDAIITAAMLLLERDADIILVVGAESILSPAVISSLAQARALSRRNEDPATASRPFDLMRDGFVVGEGAGAIVLETEESAKGRGAQPLAVLQGWANTLDAWHVTAPDPEGKGAARCMKAALARAKLPPQAIGYINAHGTATPLGDLAETRAIKNVFGAHIPPISSTKGATGHLMGAGGLTEAIACIKALETGLLPPTLNLTNPDPECDLDFIPNKFRKAYLNAAMSNSLGFGGQNSSLIFTRF